MDTHTLVSGATGQSVPGTYPRGIAGTGRSNENGRRPNHKLAALRRARAIPQERSMKAAVINPCDGIRLSDEEFGALDAAGRI